MKAIVQHTYGSADVLELAQIDQPDVGDDEVLVRVHAAGWTAACGTSPPGSPIPSGSPATV